MTSQVTLSAVLEFFEKAVPEPTETNFLVQLGCHFEEIEELLHELDCKSPVGDMLIRDAIVSVGLLADYLKNASNPVDIVDRTKFLDALCDQIVTAAGSAYMAGMNIEQGIDEVARSNLSKFDAEGNPIFNEQGKIMKGPDYRPADLQLFV